MDQVIESPLEDSDAYDWLSMTICLWDQIIRVVNASCATRKSSKIQMSK